VKRIAFFDLKGEELSIYIIEKDGKTCRLKDTISTSVRGEDLFGVERTFEDIEESYLSLPLSILNFRTIELPFNDMERVREVLPFELEGLTLDSPEDFVFDACPLGGHNRRYKFLAVYIMKENLRRILEKLRVLKVDPRIVTSIELTSLISSSLSDEEIAHLILNPKQINDEDRINMAIKEIKKPAINLRKGEFFYRAETEKTKRSLKFTAILFALIMLVFLSDMTLRIVSIKREISSVKNEIRKSYISIFPHEKKVTSELYQIKAHLKELREKERSFIGVSPLQFLLDLTRIIKHGISFTEITIDRQRIVLKGECGSLSDVQQIKNSLEYFLTDVNISDVNPLSQNRTVFTITAKEKKA
jgi:hypothetical protein